jgi:NAD(P)-dependent dehydrogenase (short-subunit alcohol dehydrogenase family)
MQELAGRTAVVTGAGSGIGAALCDAFAAEGMSIVAADIEAAALAETEARLRSGGTEVLAVPTDVTRPESVDELAAAALDRFGAVHVVCNNAGVGGQGPPWDLATWRWVVDVNLFGIVHGVHTFLPILLEQGEGHIVNTASMAGVMPSPVGPAYCATKHAVVGLTQRLYLEVHDKGVGVSALCPGMVATRIVDAERNWPEELGPSPVGQLNEEEQELLDLFRGALESSGLPPAEVAAQVVAAVRDDRFWIFTHPEHFASAGEHLRRVAEALPPQL